MAAARLAGVAFRVVTRRLDLRVGRNPWSRAKYGARGVQYIAISRQVADSLVAGGVPRSRISIVPSGVPAEEIASASDPEARRRARATLNLPADARVIGMVGAFTAQKGHETAVAALAGMKSNVRLVLIGDGPDRPRIEQRVHRMGLAGRVMLAGRRNDVTALWPAFDVVWAPSRHEGLGTAVLEAMAAGVPVVASRVSAFPEILEEGACGRLLPPEDTGAWARVTDSLLEDPAERDRLAKAALQRVQSFTACRMVEGTENVYKMLACSQEDGS
jgi:glycosyltransferase involved in cell wall biosynthesis